LGTQKVKKSCPKWPGSFVVSLAEQNNSTFNA
jgi:hypothetical protein